MFYEQFVNNPSQFCTLPKDSGQLIYILKEMSNFDLGASARMGTVQSRNSAAARSIRCAIRTPKGQRLSQALQPTHSSARWSRAR